MKKKRWAAAAAALLMCAAPLPASAASGYSDVAESDWFCSAVKAMTEKNIISGDPDGTFRPMDTVTFGDFITMAVKAATGQELPAAAAPEHWSKNYYDLALEKGYLSDRNLPPTALDAPIPREHMAVIVSNILGKTVDVSGEFYTLLQESVSDVEASTPHEYEIIRSYGAGILSGYPDGTFRPAATLDRGEAASVIWHLADESRRKIPNAAELKAVAEKQSEKRENLSQEDRIRDILEKGPQKISFDPAADETVNVDGRTVMREEKAREYMDQILAGLKFYGSGGKYYMTVTLPQVPEGYRVQFGAEVYFKQDLMKPSWLAKTGAVNPEDNIPREGTIVREITGMKSLAEVYTAGVGISINKIDDTYIGSEEASYQMQRAYDNLQIYDTFAINRQGSATEATENYFYSLDRHYGWQ
ncbi:S-layer homology domain-containing protein [Bacilliculturomica massiliensis]|uniref:S-layer homology domain-containing protein n=1 Tax=Bacilliculturomica massiliensis TaxID=1917867 RepID=UPI001031F815|nr:S-layer homology domain-containing protein [Bacilliculturomica massiliensis]